ncbi:MAG: hypothetical protein EXX96DRAFT_586796 [Benjaminiella poitrasii]|nr:MAG: hypothetical protein EXX96DRAFT_589255 [Benjaminiella poitrasii]KAI9471062.1 MAG: hypothetical protein EXX96DRAFT_586796 [Benjaminiella poitrasii]
MNNNNNQQMLEQLSVTTLIQEISALKREVQSLSGEVRSMRSTFNGQSGSQQLFQPTSTLTTGMSFSNEASFSVEAPARDIPRKPVSYQQEQNDNEEGSTNRKRKNTVTPCLMAMIREVMDLLPQSNDTASQLESREAKVRFFLNQLNAYALTACYKLKKRVDEDSTVANKMWGGLPNGYKKAAVRELEQVCSNVGIKIDRCIGEWGAYLLLSKHYQNNIHPMLEASDNSNRNASQRSLVPEHLQVAGQEQMEDENGDDLVSLPDEGELLGNGSGNEIGITNNNTNDLSVPSSLRSTSNFILSSISDPVDTATAVSSRPLSVSTASTSRNKRRRRA